MNLYYHYESLIHKYEIFLYTFRMQYNYECNIIILVRKVIM